VDPIIEIKHLPAMMLEARMPSIAFPADLEDENERVKVPVRQEKKEEEELAALYRQYKSTRKVAQILGIHQSTVVRRLKKYESSQTE
jgi:TyrR family helix-turn-helix protein